MDEGRWRDGFRRLQLRREMIRRDEMWTVYRMRPAALVDPLYTVFVNPSRIVD
jgi:hypothetical protein